jgi:hypothetical protein
MHLGNAVARGSGLPELPGADRYTLSDQNKTEGMKTGISHLLQCEIQNTERYSNRHINKIFTMQNTAKQKDDERNSL